MSLIDKNDLPPELSAVTVLNTSLNLISHAVEDNVEGNFDNKQTKTFECSNSQC